MCWAMNLMMRARTDAHIKHWISDVWKPNIIYSVSRRHTNAIYEYTWTVLGMGWFEHAETRDTEKVYRHKLKCNLKFCIYVKTPQLLFQPQGMLRSSHIQRTKHIVRTYRRRNNGRTVNDAFIQQLETASILHSLTHYTPCKCIVRSSAQNGPKNEQNFFSTSNSLQGLHISDGQWSLRWCDERPVSPSQQKKNVHGTPLHWFSLLWRRMCAPPQRYARCESLLNVHLAHFIYIETH